MPLSIAALVLLSAALHPVWNLLVKRHASPAGAFVTLGATLAATALGQALVAGAALLPPPAAWPLVAVSAAGQAVYGTALVLALRRGDLSAYYPIVRASPVAIVLFGWLVLDGSYGPGLLAGIGLVLAGGFLLQMAPGRRLDDPPTLAAAVLAMLGSATYSIADGALMRMAEPVVVLFWAQLLALPVQLAAFRLAGMPLRLGGAGTAARAVAAGLLAYASYYLILLAFQLGGAVAAVAGVRQASIPLSVLIGALWLGERNLARRLPASLLVAGGVLLIVLGP
ncbi:hypothetical protein [Azospirillum sp. ST 5-10]|uniref:hypothetical protein n=1 Tax=unclassified Azospirillum TaxID=2630922 RepID=UPI003F4A83FC